MAKTKRDKRIEARKKLFRQIIRVLTPAIRKYGKEDVRLAMNYWNRIELERKKLRGSIEASQKELQELEEF